VRRISVQQPTKTAVLFSRIRTQTNTHKHLQALLCSIGRWCGLFGVGLCLRLSGSLHTNTIFRCVCERMRHTQTQRERERERETARERESERAKERGRVFISNCHWNCKNKSVCTQSRTRSVHARENMWNRQMLPTYICVSKTKTPSSSETLKQLGFPRNPRHPLVHITLSTIVQV